MLMSMTTNLILIALGVSLIACGSYKAITRVDASHKNATISFDRSMETEAK